MNGIAGAIENIIRAAPRLSECDYMGPDGLMLCGNCHTPRQTRISLLGKEMTVPVMCRCMVEQENKEKQAEREKYIRELKRIGLREPADAECTFENDDRKDPALSAAMKRYAEQFDTMREQNMGLLLHGPVGTGKTFYAACIANYLMDQTMPVKMTNFTRIINTMQGSFDGRDEYIRNLNRYPLLIIDDLGVERESEYMQEQVYNIIDARYAAGRPLIVTTNISLEEIKNPKNVQRQRIYDRILEICHPVKVDGHSRRRQAVRDNFAERNKLLGL